MRVVFVLSHFSHVWLFVTPWTVAYQAPLSLGFSKQEYWSGLPCPPPGDLLWSGDWTCISCIGRWVLYPPSHLGSSMHILWHIQILSLWYSRYITMGCISLSCHISCSGGGVEIRHTTDSGLFMMAKNLTHLEYLKYHNSDTTLPDSKRALALEIPANIQQLLYIFWPKYYENISPNIRLLHLYEQGAESWF